jgi:hypothetical protein
MDDSHGWMVVDLHISTQGTNIQAACNDDSGSLDKPDISTPTETSPDEDALIYDLGAGAEVLNAIYIT